MLRRCSLALASIALAACVGETARQPAPPPASSGAPTTSTAAGTVAPDSARADSGAASTAAAPDSAAATTPAPSATTTAAAPAGDPPGKLRIYLEPGRTKHDSLSLMAAIRAGERKVWPTFPDPLPGAILPAKRVVAYYGNPLSKRMGALGEYEPQDMLNRLDREVKAWAAADPSTPVQPALHMVAIVAQGQAGRDGKWRTRMDSALIEKVYGWAKSRNALFFVDIQVGWSTVQAELPYLMKFLERPDVHLGLDPEFSMHHSREGVRPSAKIGVMDAAEINWAIRQLSDLVRQKNLPPKILVVHRFTQRMVNNASEIRPDPRVQVVIDMDGWGPAWLKFDSYQHYAVAEPVQFTGFKIFYGNDTKKGGTILTPREVLQLKPKPIYIQYQ